MGSSFDKLNKTIETKNKIKEALYTSSNVFADYPNIIKKYVENQLVLASTNGVCNNAVQLPVREYVIEGNSSQDNTIAPTPEHPLEIKSVGEYVSTDGYKVPILIRGKNLVIFDNSTKKVDGLNYTIKGNHFAISGNSSSTKVAYNPLLMLYMDAGTYTISLNNIKGTANKNFMQVFNADATQTICSQLGINRTSNTFTLTSNQYIQFRVIQYSDSVYDGFETDIMIEEGANVTDYQDYSLTTTDLYITEPLHKIGNYADYIEYKNGVAKVVRETKSVQASNLTFTQDAGNNRLVANIEDMQNVDIATNDIVAEQYQVATDGTNNTMYHQNKQILCYKTDLGIAPSGEIIYPLAAPTYEEIGTPILELHDGYNKVTVDTAIQPSGQKWKYVVDINSYQTAVLDAEIEL